MKGGRVWDNTPLHSTPLSCLLLPPSLLHNIHSLTHSLTHSLSPSLVRLLCPGVSGDVREAEMEVVVVMVAGHVGGTAGLWGGSVGSGGEDSGVGIELSDVPGETGYGFGHDTHLLPSQNT